MIVSEDGSVSGSLDRVWLKALHDEATSDDLKAYYRELLGDSEEGQAIDVPAGDVEFITPELASVIEPELERPADSAAKGDWVAWAVHLGATEDDASAATKAELIELYGGEA